MALVYQAAGRRETRITGLTAQGMHLHGRVWPSIGAGGDLSDLAVCALPPLPSTAGMCHVGRRPIAAEKSGIINDQVNKASNLA
jgi:hypothetical protein